MATIILPDRLMITEPQIIQYPRTPRFEADGAVIRDRGPMQEIVFFIGGRDPLGPVHCCLEVGMPEAGFNWSLLKASLEMLPRLSEFTLH